MYEARAEFTLQGRSKYQFDEVIELDGIRLETRNGKICGEVVVQTDKADFNLVAEKAFKKANKTASLLTLLFGEGFAVEDVVPRYIVAVEEKEHAKEIEIHEFVRLHVEASLTIERRFSKEDLSKTKSELKELLNKLSKLERGEDLLGVIRWWRKGYLEEDKVDKFLDYYIALEMLASIKGYKDKYQDWVRKFSEDYSITYKPDGRVGIDKIRNRLMHAPGPEKDEAEKLVELYADRFGAELLKAIRKVVDEATPS